MKYYITILIAILSVFTACQSDPPAKDNAKAVPVSTSTTAPVPHGEVTITGSIANPKHQTIKILKGRSSQSSKIVDGQFQINRLVEGTGMEELKYGMTVMPLYLRPGDAIHIAFDDTDMEGTMKITGDNADIQDYLFLKSMDNKDLRVQQQKYIQLDEADFMQQADAQYRKELDFLKRYQKDHHPLPADFVHLETVNIEYDRAQQYMMYDLYKSRVEKDNGYAPSATFAQQLASLDLNNPANVPSEKYRNFIFNNLYNVAIKNVKADPGRDMTTEAFDLIDANHNTPALQEDLAHKVFMQHLQIKGTDGTDDLYPRYKNMVNDPQKLAAASEAYNIWLPLKKGNVAPAFAYPDKAGNITSLESLKGNVVLVDIWASWCGPCKVEIPHLETLQEKFRGKKVAFVSVSIDRDRNKWEKMLADKNLKGIQLIADQAGNSKICRDYKVQGIPRFLLIDQAGKIVSAHADRPSSGKLEGLIEGLM